MEDDKGNDQSVGMMRNTVLEGDNGYDPTVFPPGYVFCPTDEELVGHYLTRKMDDLSLPCPPINEINIYDHNPMDLPAMFQLIKVKEWYFFTPRFKRYPNGDRPNRSAKGGHWKPSTAERPVFDERKNKIGHKRKLVFHEESETSDKSNTKMTDWQMLEYRIHQDNTPSPTIDTSDHTMKLDDCVLVKIYKKRKRADKGLDNLIAAEEVGQPSHDQDQAHMLALPPPPSPFPGVGERQHQAPPLPPCLSPIQAMEPFPGQYFHGLELPPIPEVQFFYDMGLYGALNLPPPTVPGVGEGQNQAPTQPSSLSPIQAIDPRSGQYFQGLELPPIPEVQFLYDTGLYSAPNPPPLPPIQGVGEGQRQAPPQPPSLSLIQEMEPRPGHYFQDLELPPIPFFYGMDLYDGPIYGLPNLASNSQDNQIVPPTALAPNDQATAPPDQLGDGFSLVTENEGNVKFYSPTEVQLNDPVSHEDGSQVQQIGGADSSKLEPRPNDQNVSGDWQLDWDFSIDDPCFDIRDLLSDEDISPKH